MWMDGQHILSDNSMDSPMFRGARTNASSRLREAVCWLADSAAGHQATFIRSLILVSLAVDVAATVAPPSAGSLYVTVERRRLLRMSW
jgi:hypothetical protein